MEYLKHTYDTSFNLSFYLSTLCLYQVIHDVNRCLLIYSECKVFLQQFFQIVEKFLTFPQYILMKCDHETLAHYNQLQLNCQFTSFSHIISFGNFFKRIDKVSQQMEYYEQFLSYCSFRNHLSQRIMKRQQVIIRIIQQKCQRIEQIISFSKQYQIKNFLILVFLFGLINQSASPLIQFIQILYSLIIFSLFNQYKQAVDSIDGVNNYKFTHNRNNLDQKRFDIPLFCIFHSKKYFKGLYNVHVHFNSEDVFFLILPFHGHIDIFSHIDKSLCQYNFGKVVSCIQNYRSYNKYYLQDAYIYVFDHQQTKISIFHFKVTSRFMQIYLSSFSDLQFHFQSCYISSFTLKVSTLSILLYFIRLKLKQRNYNFRFQQNQFFDVINTILPLKYSQSSYFSNNKYLNITQYQTIMQK